MVTVDHPAVVVEAVKLADDGSGDVIVRCYEAHGGRAVATVTPGFDAGRGVATDAHEQTDTGVVTPTLDWDGGAATVTLRPFQIATLRFVRE